MHSKNWEAMDATIVATNRVPEAAITDALEIFLLVIAMYAPIIPHGPVRKYDSQNKPLSFSILDSRK